MIKSCESLISWFITHGGSLGSDVEMVWSPEAGQHFRAKQHITTAGSGHNATLLCSCPFSLTLSILNLTAESTQSARCYANTSACAHLVGKVEDSTLGYFFLAEQRALGPASFWAPYIDLLPTGADMSTPLWFGDEDLLWVLGTNIHASGDDPSKSATILRQRMWREEHAKGIEVLKSQGIDVSRLQWHDFLWAATIFTSRAFTSQIINADTGDKQSFSLLYPVVDALNHKFGAKVLWNMHKGDFDLSTLEQLTPGHQIYNNYAPKGNEELLMGYGFCVPGNPCDQYAIRMSRPPPDVHEQLQTEFPEQFSTGDWSMESSTFYLRGSGHHTGGYRGQLQREIPCLRGVPTELFSFICAVQKYSDPSIGDEELTDASIYAIYTRLGMLRGNILEANDRLRKEPRNERQKHAKIYRDGQLAIMSEIIAELAEFLGEEDDIIEI